VFQPGGLSRSFVLCLWWGGGATGGGCPAAAGGGHWLLVGSEPLPEVAVGRGEGNAGSAWFQSDHLGKRVGQSEGHGFL
jgi:hypothetical protein